MEKVILSAPFAKTVETKDNGREIWGWATLETVDKSGEIADFEGTVKAFEKWSNETSKRTNGRNLGNIRLMHGPVAIGKTIHWSPSETTITDENGNEKTVKGIWVGGYIPPTKQEVIRDIDEGILSAFSIGGSYQKRWWDDGAQAFRFIPELSEYSLVDNPAVPNASVEQVIQKSDAPWNRKEGENMPTEIEKKGSPKGGETMTKGSEKSMNDELVKVIAGMTDEQKEALLKALTPQDQPPAPESVTTIDGDGDEDENKEFPHPNDDAASQSKVESDVKAAEEESGVAEKSAEVDLEKTDIVPDDDQPEDGEEAEKCANCGGMHKTSDCTMAEKAAPSELEKAGKAISNKNGVHLQHAANHIGAVMKGADYTADDHLVVEGQYGQGGTGEEAPEVDVEKVFSAIFTPIIEATVAKAMEAQLQKSAKAENQVAELISKGMLDKMKSQMKDQLDPIEKAIGKMDEIEKMVKEIHETPQAGGPLLNGGNPALFAKNFNQVDVASIEVQALEKFAKETKDPVVKDRIGQELAARKMRDVFNR